MFWQTPGGELTRINRKQFRPLLEREQHGGTKKPPQPTLGSCLYDSVKRLLLAVDSIRRVLKENWPSRTGDNSSLSYRESRTEEGEGGGRQRWVAMFVRFLETPKISWLFEKQIKNDNVPNREPEIISAPDAAGVGVRPLGTAPSSPSPIAPWSKQPGSRRETIFCTIRRWMV